MISIILPVYNQLEMTRECINTIQTNTTDYELIMIDNGSEPVFSLSEYPWVAFTEENEIKQFHYSDFEGYGNIKVIRNEENLGFPVAANQGIRVANKGDVIVLLNNDVFVTPGWAERLIAGLEKYDIIGPCTNYSSGLQQVRLEGIYHNLDELNSEAVKWSEMHDGKTDEVTWLIGFCFAFKKSLYNEIGEFDEFLWPSSGEEIDFCLRAKQAGKKIGIARDVYVHHEGSVTFKEMNSEYPYKDIIEKSEKHLKDKWKEAYSVQEVI